MGRRRPPKHVRRAAYYRQQFDAAPTGAQALDAAWNWLAAVLADLEQREPARAERGRRSLAEQVAEFARDADRR